MLEDRLSDAASDGFQIATDFRRAKPGVVVVPLAQSLPSLRGVWVAFQEIPPIEGVDVQALTTEERALYQTLGSDHRRCEWWSGRMAARGALRAVGAGAASILRAPNGAPLLSGPHAHQTSIAITHGRRWAAAAASRRQGVTPNIGLDLVDVEDRPRVVRIADRNFRPYERSQMAVDPDAGLLAWAAREAAAKATRTGMFAFALSEVSLTNIDRPTATLTLENEGMTGAMAAAPDGGWLVFVQATEEAVDRARTIAQRRNAPPDR
ncbi:MAG: 4'-phosphopantetheinyl transferase superfamily protein [Myxococcota bacterium]